MVTGNIFGTVSGRIVLLLLAAVLLTGLGRILLLPPYEGYDENAHYARLQAEAFAAPGVPAYFMSTEVMDYPAHGPMSPRWIFARAFNPAYREAVKTGKPMQVMETFKTLHFADYRDFFTGKGQPQEYKSLYREKPGVADYTPSTGVNWQYQHPQLYYVLFGQALKTVADTPLIPRLAVLRILSYLLAFAGFAITLFATWKHLEIRKHPAAQIIALFGAFYPFVMPMYFEEFARLGNDSLCALLFAAIWALMLWHLRQPQEKTAWVLIGLCIGISCLVKMLMLATGIGFLFFMMLNAFRKDSGATRLPARLMPAVVAGAIAGVIAAWAKTVTAASGSIELATWLQGRGFVPGEGLAWKNMFWNVQNLFTSMVYNFSDLGLFHWGTTVIAAFFIALLAVLGAWLAALPRDLRREEWLPFYLLAPLAAGLLLHAVLGGFAYRPDDVGVTPGRYIHVAAPALMLIFGTGLWRLSLRPKGPIFCGILLSAAFVLNIAIVALRSALFTGCLWVSDSFTRVHFDLASESCRPQVIYQRLDLLAYAGAGLGCVLLGLVALAAALCLYFRKPSLEV